MLVVTSENVPGKEIKEVIGIVQGSIVLSKNMFSDIGASFKTLVGGELKGYSDMMEQARTSAYERMVKDGENKGANAIIMTRVTSSSVMQGASEILMYGTAVKVE